MRDLHIGEEVLWHSSVYEITRKHTGVNLYEISKVHRMGKEKFFTNVHDGIYGDELVPVTEAMEENARDIHLEMQETRGDL